MIKSYSNILSNIISLSNYLISQYRLSFNQNATHAEIFNDTLEMSLQNN